jgi:hypothetical protein
LWESPVYRTISSSPLELPWFGASVITEQASQPSQKQHPTVHQFPREFATVEFATVPVVDAARQA